MSFSIDVNYPDWQEDCPTGFYAINGSIVAGDMPAVGVTYGIQFFGKSP
jgi:hypothetical protein